MTVEELIEALSRMPKKAQVMFNAQGSVDLALHGTSIKATVREEPVVVTQVVDTRVQYVPRASSRKRWIRVVALNPTWPQIDRAKAQT